MTTDLATLNKCLLCHEPTCGSIGAAGYYWSSICQICKDSEDAALALRVKATAKGLRFILGSLGLGEQKSDVDALSTEERIEQFK